MSWLEQYLEPVDTKVWEKLKAYLEPTKELLVFSHAVIDELNKEKITQADMSYCKQFCLYLFFKSTSHGISLWLLASRGHNIEASILAISVVEADIQLRYVMDKGPSKCESRSKEFFDYLRFRGRNDLTVKLQIAKKIEDAEKVEEFSKILKELKQEFGNKKHTDFWPHKSLEELSRIVGPENYHATVYGPYSGYVHHSWDCLHEFRSQDKNRWAFRRSVNNIDYVLVVFYENYFHIIEGLFAGFWGYSFKAYDTFSRNLADMKAAILSNRGIDPLN